MRLFFFIFFLILLENNSNSQTPTRNTSKVPTRSEIRSEMNQVINELNKQIAETEKELAEAIKNKEEESVINDLKEQLAMLKKQVGLMTGVNKNVTNISDKTFNKALEEENNDGVPLRDETRINAIPKKPLTDAELVLFVQKIFTAVDNKIPALQKINAKDLYNEINLETKSPASSGVVAVQCWLAGATDKAIWMLGKACLDDMTNTDNLANYASLLSMVGGEHLAIPILQNLNAKFPDNTTILNNLGQAWYGLGEMNNASYCLGAAARLTPAHPHATETISDVDGTEGKKEESIEELKRSIKKEYTPDKEVKLEKKGVKLKYDEIDDPECSFNAVSGLHASQLGFERFVGLIPEYPLTGGTPAQTLYFEWHDLRQKISQAKQSLDDEQIQLTKKAGIYRDNITSNPYLLKPYNNRQYLTASRKLALLIEWGMDRLADISKKIMAADDTISKWKKEYYEALAKTESCSGRYGLATAFNAKANSIWHVRNDELLDFYQQFYNHQAKLFLCATTDKCLYDLNISVLKTGFLIMLMGLRCEFEVGCTASDPNSAMGKVLPDFDEVNCQYKTELSIPYAEKYFSIKVECNRMTTNFDAKFIKGSLEENLANGKYKGTVEIEVKVGSDKIPVGPIEMGTQVKAGAGIDFTEGGIQDAYVTGEAGVKTGQFTAGSVEARVSVITGNTSVSGKGAFNGISIK